MNRWLYRTLDGQFYWVDMDSDECFVNGQPATHEEIYQFGRDSKADEILEALTRERYAEKER